MLDVHIGSEPAYEAAPESPSATRSFSFLNASICWTVTSSWWAIQASVRPWRTQPRIWLRCGRNERRAMSLARECMQMWILYACRLPAGGGVVKVAAIPSEAGRSPRAGPDPEVESEHHDR